jgi:glyoxylase-like metal-dependent hydrolase (beta-lactamase superfamily II)
MILKTFVEPPIENNNYLLIDEESREAALIDCSAPDKRIKQAINDAGAALKYILLTHGHFDHIAGIRPTDAKIVMNENDLGILKKANQYLSMFGAAPVTIPKIDIFIKDGDIIKLGNIELKVIHTPGHTQGGVCYLTENILFSGDTIFRESVGRCDMEGGDFEQIKESIESKIFTLPEETLIYSGHGPSTNVGWEKEHNMFL